MHNELHLVGHPPNTVRDSEQQKPKKNALGTSGKLYIYFLMGTNYESWEPVTNFISTLQLLVLGTSDNNDAIIPAAGDSTNFNKIF